MELRQEFQKTEIGDLPSDWAVCRLGDLAKVHDGTHQTPKYVADGIPFYSVEHVTNGDFSNTKFISMHEHKFLTRKFKMQKGDILMTRIGSIGDCRLIDWDLDASFYVSLALLKVHGAYAPYLAQYSKSVVFKQEVDLHSLPSAIPRKINLGPISDIRVAIPPESEQISIAKALSDVDALISGLEKLIAKKRDLKQAAMQQLLTGQSRLPGFSGEWVLKSLGEIAFIKTGTRNNENKVDDGLYPFFVRSAHVERINTYSLECEAILVPGEGQIGNIFHYINGRFDVHQRVYAITKFIDGVSGQYIYLYMSQHFGEWAMQNTVKATVDSLRLPTFQTFKVQLPPTIEEQTAIAQALSDMDIEITSLKSRLAKTSELKQGMMQELLTGRARLI
jgi:type I restriction enzyme S subunit